jgi:hypothetical protein
VLIQEKGRYLDEQEGKSCATYAIVFTEISPIAITSTMTFKASALRSFSTLNCHSSRFLKSAAEPRFVAGLGRFFALAKVGDQSCGYLDLYQLVLSVVPGYSAQ